MHVDRFSLRALYLYSVCLITLLISIFAVSHTVRSGVELAWPDPYRNATIADPVTGTLEVRETDRALADASSRRWAVLDLIGSVSMLTIAAPTYLYHWRRVQRDRLETREPTS